MTTTRIALIFNDIDYSWCPGLWLLWQSPTLAQMSGDPSGASRPVFE
jgi:hypothetical protein